MTLAAFAHELSLFTAGFCGGIWVALIIQRAPLRFMIGPIAGVVINLALAIL